MTVLEKLQKMMEADTKCAHSTVPCSKCKHRLNCDILNKYLAIKRD